MTYQTPELLLVGAASNLVLGWAEDKNHGLNEDENTGTYTEVQPFDSDGW